MVSWAARGLNPDDVQGSGFRWLSDLAVRQLGQPVTHLFVRYNPAGRDIGFGFGIHTCVGAQLGRLEIRIVIEQVLARLPDIVNTGEVISTKWEFGNGEILESVPVTFTPPIA